MTLWIIQLFKNFLHSLCVCLYVGRGANIWKMGGVWELPNMANYRMLKVIVSLWYSFPTSQLLSSEILWQNHNIIAALLGWKGIEIKQNSSVNTTYYVFWYFVHINVALSCIQYFLAHLFSRTLFCMHT